MNSFLKFLFNNPFFATCFLFYLVPFWVPILAIAYGADPVLMILLTVMTILAKSYIDAEILAINPFNKIFEYFIASPFKAFFKFLFTGFIISIVLAYAIMGGPLDKGIAAVFIVFIFKLIYFRPAEEKFWQLTGFKTHKYINIAGRIFTAILWLLFLSVDFQLLDSMLVATLAILTAGLTFYKTNEGLI